MLLSPKLRKIATVALLLPAAVMANASYADCTSDKSYAVEVEGGRWELAQDARHSDKSVKHVIADDPGSRDEHARLSRREFYGRQVPVAIGGRRVEPRVDL